MSRSRSFKLPGSRARTELDDSPPMFRTRYSWACKEVRDNKVVKNVVVFGMLVHIWVVNGWKLCFENWLDAIFEWGGVFYEVCVFVTFMF